MNEHKDRIRILRSVRAAMAASSAFDDEDLGFIDDAIERESFVDEELLALQDKLPARIKLLKEMDYHHHITIRFPELCSRFVEKDADLQAILEEKLAAMQARRT